MDIERPLRRPLKLSTRAFLQKKLIKNGKEIMLKVIESRVLIQLCSISDVNKEISSR